MKILMIYTDWSQPYRTEENLYGGGGYYRIVKIAEQLRKSGYDVDVMGKESTEFAETAEENWRKIFTTYDIVWTRFFDNPVAAAWVFSLAKHYNKPVILDIDDDLLNVNESNPSYETYKPGSEKRAYATAILSFANAIVCSTQPLLETYTSHIQEVHGIEKSMVVIPNLNDINDWPKKNPKRVKSNIIIGYAGSVSHDDDLKLVLPTIKKIMEKNKKIRFELMGIVQSSKVKEFFHDFPEKLFERVSVIGATPGWKGYPEHLNNRRWNIGIAPLVDNQFNRAKSHIKWMEYAMCGIPCIASDVTPYSDYMQQGMTGMLVKPHEWEEVLTTLIESAKLREELATNARNHIEKSLQYGPRVTETFKLLLKDLSVNE